jgi:hypothetical protein
MKWLLREVVGPDSQAGEYQNAVVAYPTSARAHPPCLNSLTVPKRDHAYGGRMKTLIKLAVGAAIAGSLVNILIKRRSGSRGRPTGSYDENVWAGTAGSGVGVVADTNSLGREASARGTQPQDWRGAQNVLDS